MKKILILMFVSMFIGLSAQQKMKNYDNIIKSTNIYEIDAFLRDAHPDDPRRAVLKPRLMDLIKNYLKTAHEDDQKVPALQEKLALLRKRPSTKISFEEMNAKIREKQIKYQREKLAALQAGKNSTPIAATEVKMGSEAMVSAPEGSKTSTIDAIRAKNAAGGSSASSSARAAAKNMAAINSEKEEFAMLMNMSADEHKNRTVKILNALFDNDPNSKETTVLIKNTSDCDIIVRIEGIGYTKFRLAVASKSENTIVVPKGDYLFTSIVCGAQYASQKSLRKAIMVTLGNPKQ